MSIQFSKDHEWINAADPAAAVVGITVHAQDALGDVVFVDLPAVGTTFAQVARQMHEGEVEERPIRGTATPQERQELAEDGIEVMALPLPDAAKHSLQ